MRGLRQAGAAAVGAVLLSALTALVAGGTLAGQVALARLTSGWRADLRLVATLREAPARPGASPGIVATVRVLPGVAAVRYVSADEALADLRRYLGGSAEGLDQLPSNPVPARLEITPVATLDAAGLRGLLAAVGRAGAVEEIEAAIGWVEPAERVERGLRAGGRALAGLLALGALLAATGTAGAIRQARSEETAVLRLAGVSETRLWSPVLLPPLLAGALGAALGAALLWLASEAGAPWLGGWLRLVAGTGTVPLLPPAVLAVLVSGGALVGLTGGLAGGRP